MLPKQKRTPQNIAGKKKLDSTTMAEMDVFGFVSPRLRNLRSKADKTPEEWNELSGYEDKRREPTRDMTVNIPNTIQEDGTSIPAYRNHNPGNLEGRPWQRGRQDRPNERFAGFISPEIGALNLRNSLRRYQHSGVTIDEFVHTYAPAHENDTEGYIRKLEKRFGTNRSTALRYLPLNDLSSFMAQQESGTKINYGSDPSGTPNRRDPKASR